MNPIVCDCEVDRVHRLGEYVVLTIRAPEIAAGAQPGQFLNVTAPPALLRRPFSVYRSEPATGEVAVAFDAIGSGTRWLASRAPGDRVDVVGPLGTGFPFEPGPALLVGGGYGTAALSFLAAELARRSAPVHAIVGARSARRLFLDDGIRGICESLEVVTEDGSMGARGIVTDAMPGVIERQGIATVYACGPNRMLEAVGALAETLGVPSRLAVEEFMACGIGVCWTCVFPVRVNGEIKHLRSCTEGPVFEGAAIAWA